MAEHEVDELLARHEYRLQMRLGAICSCGFVPEVDPESLATQQDYHRRHLASLIAEHTAEVVRVERAALVELRDLLHEALGGTPGEHLSRRMEAIAQAHETSLGQVARVRAVLDTLDHAPFLTGAVAALRTDLRAALTPTTEECP